MPFPLFHFSFCNIIANFLDPFGRAFDRISYTITHLDVSILTLQSVSSQIRVLVRSTKACYFSLKTLQSIVLTYPGFAIAAQRLDYLPEVSITSCSKIRKPERLPVWKSQFQVSLINVLQFWALLQADLSCQQRSASFIKNGMFVQASIGQSECIFVGLIEPDVNFKLPI